MVMVLGLFFFSLNAQAESYDVETVNRLIYDSTYNYGLQNGDDFDTGGGALETSQHIYLRGFTYDFLGTEYFGVRLWSGNDNQQGNISRYASYATKSNKRDRFLHVAIASKSTTVNIVVCNTKNTHRLYFVRYYETNQGFNNDRRIEFDAKKYQLKINQTYNNKNELVIVTTRNMAPEGACNGKLISDL